MTQRHTRNEIPGPKHSVIVRLPTSLHKQLVSRADREKRSVAAHITYLIERDVEAQLVEEAA